MGGHTSSVLEMIIEVVYMKKTKNSQAMKKTRAPSMRLCIIAGRA